MDHYGISMVNIDDKSIEVTQVLLHKVLKKNGNGSYSLDEGKIVSHEEVASLIGRGDSVKVVAIDAASRYIPLEKVRIKLGHNPARYIESRNELGLGTLTLLAIPTLDLELAA